MNRIIIFVVIFLINNITNAQVTVTATPVFVSEINTSSFHKITINLKNGDTIKGFGSFSHTDFMSVRFLKEKPKQKSIKEWESYSAGEISKLIFNDTYIIESLTYKGNSNRYQLFWNIYSNDNIKLYTFPNRTKDSGIYLVLKKNEKKATFLKISLKNTNKSISKKVARIFKECPELYSKIIKGEYKNSYGDFIKILEFYNQNCYVK